MDENCEYRRKPDISFFVGFGIAVGNAEMADFYGNSYLYLVKSELTYIANPIYDVVFRYMMEDNKVARLFLSAVMGQEVEELKFNPTEFSGKIGGDAGITVTRMDFNARIRQPDGKEKVVLIELQKAKYYHQISRFRNYLGLQYRNPENVDREKNPLPIYPIYILAESFTPEKVPVIRVNREYIDAATNTPITNRHPFIEALTHDATVIQTEHLKGSRRTVLERFLSIFDQSSQSDVKGHILALNEEDFPEAYGPVIRRLQKALQTDKIELDMELEDEVLSELNKKDLQTAAALAKAEEALRLLEEERLKAEEERLRADQQTERMKALVSLLKKQGTQLSEIAEITGMSIPEIEAFTNRD
jgi:hypothetical protein